VEKAWVDECASLFADMNAYLIGLHCPLEVLEQREKDRKDRTLGQAREQFDVIHKYVVYDLELDTSTLTVEECAEKVIERLKTPPIAFKKLKNLTGLICATPIKSLRGQRLRSINPCSDLSGLHNSGNYPAEKDEKQDSKAVH
jgi:hypothetical protein